MQLMVAASFSIRYRALIVANKVCDRAHLKTLLGEKTLLGLHAPVGARPALARLCTRGGSVGMLYLSRGVDTKIPFLEFW